MIKLERSSSIRGDETASYSVELDKAYTVADLVQEAVNKKGEWGYIGIKCKGEIFGKPNCEYKWGKLLSKLPEEYMSKKIINVEADGGWSRMDYLLEVE